VAPITAAFLPAWPLKARRLACVVGSARFLNAAPACQFASTSTLHIGGKKQPSGAAHRPLGRSHRLGRHRTSTAAWIVAASVMPFWLIRYATSAVPRQTGQSMAISSSKHWRLERWMPRFSQPHLQ